MVEEYGVLGLFSIAFLAATIFPLSSEVAFVAALSEGMNQNSALLAISAGNLLAIILNYFLGAWLREHFDAKLKASKIGRRALLYSHKYGFWALWLTPFPIIGDPLTIAAGVVKIPFWSFFALAGSLRVGRYLITLYLFNGYGIL